jgi:hypothetical protein
VTRGPLTAESIPFARPTDGGAGVATREFRALGDSGFLFTLLEVGIEFEVDRLRQLPYGLVGEVTARCQIPGARTVDGSLHTAELNLSSTRSRAEYTRTLIQRSKAPQVGWDLLVDELCQGVIRRNRLGQPAIVLRDVERLPAGDQEFDIDGLTFPKSHPTILFGDAGTAKSFLLLYILGVLAQRGVRTALFDWELDRFAHRERLERLFGPEMPDVRYVRCERPLVHELDRLKRVVRDERLEFAGGDSVGFGCAGPPENAETALDYIRSVRQLEVGSLHVAHIRQGDNNDQRPFGSTFWHASARCTWNVKLAATAPGQINTGLFNRKSNFGPLRPAVGFQIDFDDERTWIRRVNVADVNELAENLPLWQRMQMLLRHGPPKTLASLADELSTKVETLDRTIRRKSGLFARVPGSDGITRIGLVDGRRAS